MKTFAPYGLIVLNVSWKFSFNWNEKREPKRSDKVYFSQLSSEVFGSRNMSRLLSTCLTSNDKHKVNTSSNKLLRKLS